MYAIHSALLLVGVSKEVEELFQLVAEWQRQRKQQESAYFLEESKCLLI